MDLESAILFIVAAGLGLGFGCLLERRRAAATLAAERAVHEAAVAALVDDRERLLRKLELASGICPGCKYLARDCWSVECHARSWLTRPRAAA